MSFSDRWNTAGEARDEYEPPDGNYDVKLANAVARTARTSGDDYVVLTWQILKGDDVGRRFDDYNGIAHPVGFQIAREKLRMLGLPDGPMEDIEDLDRAVFELVDTIAEVTVSTNKKGYKNTAITRSMTTGKSDIPTDNPPGDPFAVAKTEDEKDIPF